MSIKLCLIPGDGIGPEVVDAAAQVLLKLLPDIDLKYAEAGWETFKKQGQSVPSKTLSLIQECDGALFGAVSSPSGPVDGYRSAIVTLRQQLKLHANIRPVSHRWRVVSKEEPSRPVNLVIVRENTEGLYAAREVSDGETATAPRTISRRASLQIGRSVCDVARSFGMQRISVVHKANVLPLSDGLFRDCVFQAIEEDSGSYEIQQALADSAAFQLVSAPESFQAIVTTNMFGDILSDVAAYWCGGMGRAPSINMGTQFAVAEPVHGSAPDIAGRGVADPTATILSAALLCRLHLKLPVIADAIESALEAVITELRCPTQLRHAQPSTAQFTQRVIAMIGTAAGSSPIGSCGCVL